jgi:CheY-like chemotaxis protein
MKKVILVVDDEPVVRKVVAAALERKGYVVLIAASAETGLEILHDFAGVVHLVLTDLRLKEGMQGLEFRARILADRPDSLVVLMSGNTYEGNIPPGVATIEKPFTPAKLCERIHQLLGLHFLTAPHGSL